MASKPPGAETDRCSVKCNESTYDWQREGRKRAKFTLSIVLWLVLNDILRLYWLYRLCLKPAKCLKHYTVVYVLQLNTSSEDTTSSSIQIAGFSAFVCYLVFSILLDSSTE